MFKNDRSSQILESLFKPQRLYYKDVYSRHILVELQESKDHEMIKEEIR